MMIKRLIKSKTAGALFLLLLLADIVIGNGLRVTYVYHAAHPNEGFFEMVALFGLDLVFMVVLTVIAAYYAVRGVPSD